MKDNTVALLRIPAFLIDFTLVMATIGGISKLGQSMGAFYGSMEVEWLIFACVPFAFFVYWALNINLGKRLFKLSIVDADSGQKPTLWQLFKRSLPFCLVISLNIIYLIPLLVSKRNQGFQDMLAGTLVVRDQGNEETSTP